MIMLKKSPLLALPRTNVRCFIITTLNRGQKPPTLLQQIFKKSKLRGSQVFLGDFSRGVGGCL